MPALADLPPQPMVVNVHSAPEAQGRDGQRLGEVAEQAFSHWENRMERLVLENGAEDGALSYEPVPLDAGFSIQVSYRYEGELQPLPYDWDE